MACAHTRVLLHGLEQVTACDAWCLTCRLGRGLERPLGAAATTGVTASLAGPSLQPPLLGALFVVAGFTGKIYVYENLPAQASKDV